jgi:ATP-dependent DNA helicase RecQ
VVQPRDETQQVEILPSTESLFQLSRNESRERRPLVEGIKHTAEHDDELDPESLRVSAMILKNLRDIYHDNDARFRSVEQGEAVKEALKRESDILVILPTGGGKSLVYQLPAHMEQDMTTVVIVPFAALVNQVKESCKELSLSCQVWRNGGDSSGNAQVIVTGAEHASTPEFEDVLIQLESTNRLSRIVIDECHTLIQHREFRPVIRRMGGLVRGVSVPLVALTATCTPDMEDPLRVLLGCENLKTIRSTEGRKELEYSVKVLGNQVESMKDLNLAVRLVLRDNMKDWESKDRGLIYCLQKSWTKDLAEFINTGLNREVCRVYHADMEAEERAEILNAWKHGTVKVLVATSALGAGLHYDHVRLVIHHGFAQSLVEFSQESGRGGRDGKKAKSATVFWKGLLKEAGWIEKEGKDIMISWINSKDCRRKGLDGHLHGSGQECLLLGKGELCDNCEARLKKGEEWSSGVKSKQKRGRDMEFRETRDGVELKEMMKELGGKCTLCWIKRKEDVGRHELARCR